MADKTNQNLSFGNTGQWPSNMDARGGVYDDVNSDRTLLVIPLSRTEFDRIKSHVSSSVSTSGTPGTINLVDYCKDQILTRMTG